ncbi:hypothetical protein G9A89_022666 [Geosiphon pyriformis]|nr:hypothetical protein G9A89_022666 [Geosiphon pyriformis]
MTQEATATLTVGITQPFENGKVNSFLDLNNKNNDISLMSSTQTTSISNNNNNNNNNNSKNKNNTELREELKTKRLSRTSCSQTPVLQLSPTKDSRSSTVEMDNQNNANSSPIDFDPAELMNSLAKTLSDYYGGGGGGVSGTDFVKDEEDFWEEPEKKRVRSNVKGSKDIPALYDDIELDMKIRDFAFPADDSRHWGQNNMDQNAIDEEDDEFTDRRARALYDFQGENESELSFSEGDILLIRSRRCAGWLVADLGEETGLVPENYVTLLGDGEEEGDDDEEEYGAWAAAQNQE